MGTDANDVDPQGATAGDTIETDERRGVKRGRSIRAKLVARVLPLIIIPLLLIGAASVLAIYLIQVRTDDAVTQAEALLTTTVVEDGINRTAQRSSRELNGLVSGTIDDTETIARRRDVGTAVGDGLQRLFDLRSTGRFDADEELQEALAGQPPLVTFAFVDSLAEELSSDTYTAQVTLASNTGVQLASSNRDLPQIFENDLWYRQTMRDGWHADSLVVEDGQAFYQVSQRIWVFAEDNVVGAVRIRIPMTAVHELLDEVTLDSDDQVAILVLDKARSSLIAETANQHDPNFLYKPASVAGGMTTLNTDLLSPGTTQDDRFLTSAQDFSRFEGMQSSFNWLIQVRQPVDVATAPLAEIRSVSSDVGATRSIVSFAVLSLTILALFVGWKSARRIADRITNPVREIAAQAEAAAYDGIPKIVEAAESSEDELPELPRFNVETKDEISVLADSLNVMQGAAVSLAAGQAQLRRQNVARTFVSLGRRNQNLLNRQLEFIDDLERSETNPDTLENLFRLDHLATRMRRNAENLLVLAGEQTPRRWAKPIAIRDVLQAAASEIADFHRVRVGDMDEATVSGTVATDLSHLIAELLENAGSFSPPNSPIDILGQQTPTHYRLAIMDQGIGMDEGSLAQANHRLANPVDFADAPSAYIGLFVVGHLAKQLGVKVRLAASEPVNIAEAANASAGTIAFIDLPNSLLTHDAATPIEVPARAQRAQQQPAPEPVSAEPVIEPATVPATEITEAGFAERGGTAPEVTDWNTTPEPAEAADEAAAAPAKTAAGFPKRRAASTSIPNSPKRMEVAPAEPVATEAPPVLAEPTAPSPPAAPDVQPAPAAPAVQPTQSAPAPQPVAPAKPAPEVTAAGLPKRTATQPITPPATPEPAPVESAEPRDARAVSNSLLSFKAAVARGRLESARSPEANGDAQSAAAAPVGAASPGAVPGPITQIHQMTAQPTPVEAAAEAPTPPPAPPTAAHEGSESADRQDHRQATGSSS